MVPRILEKTLNDRLNKKGKVQIVLGPRQAGKTTLIKSILTAKKDVLYLTGDDSDTRHRISEHKLTSLKRIIGNHKIVFVDEAQRIPNIGLALKLIVDNINTTQLIVSGSSALELSNKLNEPLTGRKFEYLLLPISLEEFSNHFGLIQAHALLNDRIIFGMYPEVINNHGNEIDVLKNLCESYLYKDLLALKEVRKPEVFEKLLKALAMQIGNEVSSREVAQTIGTDPATVDKYIGMLEKSYVIFRLTSYSRNLRSELKRARKIYFVDTGIRNALIGNFQSMNSRSDAGNLWENFVVSERLKFTNNHFWYGNRYFWRTQQQQEIDYIEEYDGKLHTCEIKWNPKRTARLPLTFKNNYPGSSFEIITPENVWDFVMKE